MNGLDHAATKERLILSSSEENKDEEAIALISE